MSETITRVWRPSTARRVVLDGFAPVPRGTGQAAPPLLAWPAKDPADVLDYEFDITAAVAGHDSDAIAMVDVIASPAGSGHLTIGDIAADGRTAVVWLAGGQAGTTYRLQITVTTTSGRTLGRAVALPVLALAAQSPPSGALLTQGGAVVTDQDGNPILLGG
ncbi:MAG: hypothetical protein IT555_05770 [Acetobacteraceae bacterium]|nr:hypothetical protein [Acetobacteraceae bacterium]